MGKEVICPWCEEKTLPKLATITKEHGTINERRCSLCGKILAAYLKEDGDFFSSIRKYPN